MMQRKPHDYGVAKIFAPAPRRAFCHDFGGSLTAASIDAYA
jgi:hypothetical protein